MISSIEIDSINWSESFIEVCSLDFNFPSPMQPSPKITLEIYNSDEGAKYIFTFDSIVSFFFTPPLNAISDIDLVFDNESKVYNLSIHDYSSRNKNEPNLKIISKSFEFEQK